MEENFAIIDDEEKAERKKAEEEEQKEKYKIEDAEANSDNIDFMREALHNDGSWVVAYASDRILSDKEFMKEAVQIDGQLLYYASPDLRDDKEIVLEAVKNKGLIIKYQYKNSEYELKALFSSRSFGSVQI